LFDERNYSIVTFINNTQPPIFGGSLYAGGGGSETYRDSKRSLLNCLFVF
jgi:hypothetical protein